MKKNLQKALSKIGVADASFWGTTLYLPEALPFTVNQIPELFTNFRKQVEKKSSIKESFPTPQKLPPLPNIKLGELLTLKDLGGEKPIFNERAVLKFIGGESNAIARLNHYFWETDVLKEYKETRNGMLGADYSSKIINHE